ncbi:hypothetical protein Q428_02280 [Fervidicella metallireducens AeB]|uniref:DUF11 domain-containing protein n=1 Tax=Fervidicella metallireducens AeB TaxID=1403537 RepID=A0A017RXT8_9CLOT|nr:DUF11 domain-containing protein [Fervidicella metallireducens]EYE89487.1 hypothetical protein Q428_02280 [Fervidicella metallireducens AeB]
MFPVNPNDWITYITTALPRNEHPCWVDIVGDLTRNAAFYYPAISPNPSEIAFRMRLNGDPIKVNPNSYELKEFVWGVQIVNNFNQLLFTIRVNASGSNYRLQVIKETAPSSITYDVPFSLNYPPLSSDIVRVVDAGKYFACGNPENLDEDYFLDFRVPNNSTVFPGFDFSSSTYKLCYFTSTQPNVVNKEYICGSLFNPPIGEPVLCVKKEIVSGPDSICLDDIDSWTLRITVENCGTVAVNNIILTDVLNNNINFLTPVTLVPSLGPSYDSNTRTITWNIGTLNPGEKQLLDISFTAQLAVCGHLILNTGNVKYQNGPDDGIPFQDEGVLSLAEDELQVTKEIIGPDPVENCEIETWTLRIKAENTNVCDITEVLIVDEINCNFNFETPIVYNASNGLVILHDKKIIWSLDLLYGNSFETLDLTFSGFFDNSGHQIFNKGKASAFCIEEFDFSDEGIEVIPSILPENIEVTGQIKECGTGQLLTGVLVTVYDSSCKEILSQSFDENYTLYLKPGTYTIKFTKAGYYTKFLNVIINSDGDIVHDIHMNKKVLCYSQGSSNTNLDILAGIVKYKIDADIIFSNAVCLYTDAVIECLTDVIDSVKCKVICNSKLLVTLLMEKDIIYKLNEEKNFKYFTDEIKLCYPLEINIVNTDFKYDVNIADVSFCKDGNIVENMALIKFKAHFVDNQDICINTK